MGVLVRGAKRLIMVMLVIMLSIILAIPVAGQVHSQTEVLATVIPDRLNVRERPSVDAVTLGAYARGMVLRITGWDGTVWVFAIPAQSDSTSLTGWVHWDYVDFPAGFDVATLPIIDAVGLGGAGGEVDAADVEHPAASGEVPARAPAEGQIAGLTLDAVNFRIGPSTSARVIRTLAGGMTVILTGRTADGAWVRALVENQVESQEGWLYATLVQIQGDANGLPVMDSGVATSPDEPEGSSTSPALPAGTAPGIPSGVIPGIGGQARDIFLAGQARGNRPNAFSKVGDSITDMPMFLYPIAGGQYDLGEYTNLQSTITHFSGSFGRVSAAAHGRWTSYDVLDPAKHFQEGLCHADESPLVCEYRVFKPAVALIMIGTNDAEFGVATADYRANVDTIVQTSITMGVIPVLSTIPDNARDAAANGRVQEYNMIIRAVAAAYGTPLWDYGRALQSLPNKGLSSDGLHPSFDAAPGTAALFTPDYMQYGFTMRNLTALLVLQAVLSGALY